jgi:hypothetical protein
MSHQPAAPPVVNASNLFGLDYAAEAASFARLPYPIIDMHAHINGREAAALYRRAAELYGVGRVYSMTRLEELDEVRAALGPMLRLIATNNFSAEDKRHALGPGYLERIERFHAAGARIAKFWAAPRGWDLARQLGEPDFMRLDAPHRVEAMQLAHDLGMIFMTHVADPDTWFETKYRDASRYGRKRDHYRPLEALLERFPQPWIAAHMGGWPEDLDFLDGLLSRHAHLHLDASATKWIVREVSRHPRHRMVEFLTRWKGRIMFGSDIVTTDEHLVARDGKPEMAAKAASREEAFDLYASRYWALRTLWETDHRGRSPIADPDLAMVDPARFGPMDSPELAGQRLPAELLRSLYHDAAEALMAPYERGP